MSKDCFPSPCPVHADTGDNESSRSFPNAHKVVYGSDQRTKRSIVGIFLPAISKKKGKEVRAWLFEDDYHRILAEYGRVTWYMNDDGKGTDPYVKASQAPRQGVTTILARFIADAGKGEYVRYLDGDKLNLKRHNLMVVKNKIDAP